MKMIVDARQQYFPEFAELASQMNHDVRSPLTAICSYAECLALLTGAELATREKYARAIIAEARRLGRMAGDFLLLSAPQPEAPLEQLDLGDVLAEALEELADVLEVQEAVVDLSAPPAPVLMSWHRPVLRHLLVSTLECVMENAGRNAPLTIGFAPQALEVAMLIGIDAAHSRTPDTRSFAFRAAARLVGTRGGSLRLLDGGQPQLHLLIPYSGALYAAPGATAPVLSKSA